MITERFFAGAEALVSALSAEIALALNEAVERRGAASLVATGGTTPGALYDALSKIPAPWDRVTVTLSDERWVGVDDKASNERLVRERLLQDAAASARFMPLKTGAPTPAGAVADVDRALHDLNPPFDFSVLGMGGDGHVASLFPHGPELIAALDDEVGALVCAVRREDAAGAAERLSLTRNGLLETRRIAVLITGDEKLAAYRRALESDDIPAMPIRMVLQQRRVPVQVWWTP